MNKNFLIALLFFLAPALTGKAGEEVQLKQRAYEPRKKLESAQFRTRSVQSVESRNIKTKQAKTRRGGWWNIFRSEKPELDDESFNNGAPAVSVPLRQNNKQISAATMKAAPSSVTEKQPYETGVSKTVKPYTPDNRPRPKNPLLRPRQNIKEPE